MQCVFLEKMHNFQEINLHLLHSDTPTGQVLLIQHKKELERKDHTCVDIWCHMGLGIVVPSISTPRNTDSLYYCWYCTFIHKAKCGTEIVLSIGSADLLHTLV